MKVSRELLRAGTRGWRDLPEGVANDVVGLCPEDPDHEHDQETKGCAPSPESVRSSPVWGEAQTTGQPVPRSQTGVSSEEAHLAGFGIAGHNEINNKSQYRCRGEGEGCQLGAWQVRHARPTRGRLTRPYFCTASKPCCPAVGPSASILVFVGYWSSGERAIKKRVSEGWLCPAGLIRSSEGRPIARAELEPRSKANDTQLLPTPTNSLARGN